MYKVKQLTDSIYHFEFNKKCDLFLSLMRMQEFYECKHKDIKGKKFTFEDLVVAYSELDNEGEFKYFQDWAAFNLPDDAVREFIKVYGDDLFVREKKILVDIKKSLDMGTDISRPMAKTYYIGTYTTNNDDSKRDLKHETAHGLFYTVTWYRKIMETLISDNKPLMKEVMKRLKEMTYSDEVLIDETQAYLATASLSELKGFGFPKLIEKDVRPFRNAYKKFTDNIKQKKKGDLMLGGIHEDCGRITEQQTTR